jgi:hypothetical protein
MVFTGSPLAPFLVGGFPGPLFSWIVFRDARTDSSRVEMASSCFRALATSRRIASVPAALRPARFSTFGPFVRADFFPGVNVGSGMVSPLVDEHYYSSGGRDISGSLAFGKFAVVPVDGVNGLC